MKKMKKITVLFAVIMMTILTGAGNQAMAQEKKSNTEEVKIQTSAVCGMCKERIEHDLSFEKGIKSVSLDNETKIVTVGYNPSKTNPDKIRLAISKIGYDADTVKADPIAYEKLPACCKKGNTMH
jgi:mercuric ion binding protein